NKEQLFWGLLIAVINPLYLHFTIKNTPEVYSALILGISLFSYIRLLKTGKIIYAVYITLSVLAGMSIKPVFFLISITMLFHWIFINRNKKLLAIHIVIIVISLFSYFAFQSLTKLERQQMNSYGFDDILSRVFLFDAIKETGEINLGTTEDLLLHGPIKSNYLLCNEKYNDWLKDYSASNPDWTESRLAFDFTKAHLLKSVLLRAASPVLFISLTSNSTETIIYFFLYGFLSVITIISIKRMYRNNKEDILIILYVLAGYYLVFFLTLSYARYSLPFMSYFLVFNGILIGKISGFKSGTGKNS
ncbi:MAG: hypothetical protein LWX07_06070, partial [Bacteroidetes bacterium]|nr:hypothetical protein [Bacteroidota bacterium]